MLMTRRMTQQDHEAMILGSQRPRGRATVLIPVSTWQPSPQQPSQEMPALAQWLWSRAVVDVLKLLPISAALTVLVQ